MTRTPYHPQRHPSHLVESWGHWEGGYDAAGEYVDTWVAHCPRHKDYLLDGCELCASRPTEGADAPKP